LALKLTGPNSSRARVSKHGFFWGWAQRKRREKEEEMRYDTGERKTSNCCLLFLCRRFCHVRPQSGAAVENGMEDGTWKMELTIVMLDMIIIMIYNLI
jgi:hypothetical protein